MKKIMAFFLSFALLFSLSADCFAAGASGPQRIGGGPSPSGAWTYEYSFSKTYTHDQLRQINNQLQGAISSPSYQAGNFAYNASIVIMGISNVPVRIVTAAGLTLFGQSQFQLIQSSANAVATAYGAGGSRTLRVQVWDRPANGETLYVISN